MSNDALRLLAAILPHATAYAEDLETGLEDGTYEDNPGLAELKAAIEEALTLVGKSCPRCQGNGEIVTDWPRYLHPNGGDKGDEAVAACPDCDGQGSR